MKRAILLTAALLALPAQALAQAYQCSAKLVPPPLPQIQPDGPSTNAPIQSYTLAVSWAPEYCRNDHDPQSVECSGRYGRFGLIVHGLWPEGDGQAPQWCEAKSMPTPDTVRRNLCMTPSTYLIAHEWAKHGSCMARNPDAYYATARKLWDKLKWPDVDALSRKPELTVGDLREAVMLANPGLRREAIGVLTSDKGWLRELRLCYTRSFKLQACKRQQYGPDDATALKIWRGI